MTIILFLVDTSASMNQKCYLGTSLLDIAKGAVETFLKLRAKDPSRGFDRYMLMSFEEPPKNVKAGWREGQAVFHEQLKNLRARGLTTFGAALGEALRFLNLNRLQTGIDFFGHGRFPACLEQVVIVAITDGGALTTPAGVSKEISVPRAHDLIGNELIDEPFRWDQRIYSLVLRLPGHSPPSVVAAADDLPADASAINAMCLATGGRSYSVTTHRALNVCIESLVQRAQSGVVVCFEKFGPEPRPVNTERNGLENGYIDEMLPSTKSEIKSEARADTPPPVWHRVQTLLHVRQRSVGHWPIPESFWPDPISSALPPRSAHPVIRFSCEPCDPIVCQDFPFDKFELEPSHLTEFILGRKQANVCWQVFIANSARFEDNGLSFGYLKASTNLAVVNLFVMPYDYPVVLPLLEDLRAAQKTGAMSKVRPRFDRYLKAIPPYYFGPLAKALKGDKLGFLMGKDPDPPYSYSVLGYLAKIRLNAKERFNGMCADVEQHLLSTGAPPPVETVAVQPRTPRSLVAAASLLGAASADAVQSLKAELNEFHNFVVPLGGGEPSAAVRPAPASMFRNPFDIPRSKLLQQIAKMRINLHEQLSAAPVTRLEGGLPGTRLKLQHAESLHSLPISQMGNYQEYLKCQEQAGKAPLKEIEAAPIRVHAFGNPFKIDKRNMLVDEADIENLLATNASSPSTSAKAARTRDKAEASGRRGAPPKRKKGPLARDFRLKRRRRRPADDDGSSLVTLSDTESVVSEAPTDWDMDETAASTTPPHSPPPAYDDDDEQVASTSAEVVRPRARRRRLGDQELRQLRRQLSLLIRQPGRVPLAVTSKAIGSTLAPADERLLLRHAKTESTRFKRVGLCKEIAACLSQLLEPD